MDSLHAKPRRRTTAGYSLERGMVVCPEMAETGSFDTRLAFFIRIWEGFMALKGVRQVF
jgi:hypothetical protein